MGDHLHMFCLFIMFCQVVVGDEHHCSKYHYESQTLERIIRAEMGLEATRNDIIMMKDSMENYKTNHDNEIVNLEEKLDLMRQTFENFVNNMTKTSDQMEPTITSSMRQFCTTDEMCSDVENAECKWLACKCKPGLSYHQGTRKCLSECGDFGYGKTYQVEMDALLTGFATKTFESVSLDECVRKCTTETSFTCRSAEYYKSPKTCYLSWETLHTNPSSHDKDNNKYVIYTRDCDSD